MEIRLDLSRHCIRTAARLKLEHLIRQCLKAPDQEVEEMIEILTDFFLFQRETAKKARAFSTRAWLFLSVKPGCF